MKSSKEKNESNNNNEKVCISYKVNLCGIVMWQNQHIEIVQSCLKYPNVCAEAFVQSKAKPFVSSQY